MNRNLPWSDGAGRRHYGITFLLAVVAVGVCLGAAAQTATTDQRGATAPPSASLKEDLTIANRILFDEGFLDTAGHVSVRLDANRFLMAWRRAPELVIVDDIMEHDLEGNVSDTRSRPPYQERYIHTEIYRARPDVRAVVHGHTPSLVMFSSSNIPLQPLFSGAGFIGQSVPAFKNGDAGGGVNTAELGRKLAEAIGTGGAVLMRGHGVVVAAPNLVALVQRSINLDTNAQLVARLLAMGDQPIYIRPNAGTGGGGGRQGGAGGDDSREWEAYRRRAEVLMKVK